MTNEEIYAYYTLRYDKTKEQFPDTFGLDVAYSTWKAKDTSKALEGYNEFVTMNDAVLPLIIQRYEMRELSAETVPRWMWLADRLMNSLCTKYAGFINEYPEFKLEQHTETIDRRITSAQNDTITNNLSQSTSGSKTSSQTESGESRQQKYSDSLADSKQAGDDATVSGQTDTQTVTDGTQVSSNVNNTGTQNRDSDGNSTESVTKNTNDENDTIMWQKLILQRKSLFDMYSDEYDRLFVSVIGDDLYLPTDEIL